MIYIRAYIKFFFEASCKDGSKGNGGGWGRGGVVR